MATSPPASPRRLAGIALQALSLYRSVLRAIATKPPEARAALRVYARTEFDEHRGLSHKQFQLVEHLLRKGQRLRDMMSRPEVSGLHLVHTTATKNAGQAPTGASGSPPARKAAVAAAAEGVAADSVNAAASPGT